jgi:hypothetical protein
MVAENLSNPVHIAGKLFFLLLYLQQLKNDLLKKLFLLLFLVIPSLVFAQSHGSLNILSENGDPFYLMLDGKKQNDIACSNIRISGVPDLYYSVKIIFADTSIAPISKNNLYISDGDDIMRDAYYRIRREKNSKPKLVFYSMLNVQQNFVATEGVHVFKFGEPAVSESIPVVEKQGVSTTVTTGPTNITGSLTVFSQNDDKFFLYLDGVKQNEVPRSNIRIRDIPGHYYQVKIVFENKKFWPITKNNVFISDEDDNLMDASYRLRSDKTGYPRFKFYSMTAANENFAVPAGMYVYSFGKPVPVNKSKDVAASKKTGTAVPGAVTNLKVIGKDDAAAKKSTVKTSTAATKPPVKNGSIGTTVNTNDKPVAATTKPVGTTKTIPETKKCDGWPMAKSDLAAAKKAIEEAGKDEAKLTAAQQIIASNCLLSSQVAEFCSLFTTEKSKLAFAKYAYKFTIDRKNYAEVNNALSLETSKKELNKFIINGG